MKDESLRFRDKHHLRGKLAFASVYEARTRATSGAITVYGRPNDLTHSRLGISIPRTVGTAVVRNRIKRLLREAFRHLQHELPKYDLIVVVRPHRPMQLEDYRNLLADLSARVRKACEGG